MPAGKARTTPRTGAASSIKASCRGLFESVGNPIVADFFRPRTLAPARPQTMRRRSFVFNGQGPSIGSDEIDCQPTGAEGRNSWVSAPQRILCFAQDSCPVFAPNPTALESSGLRLGIRHPTDFSHHLAHPWRKIDIGQHVPQLFDVISVVFVEVSSVVLGHRHLSQV